MSEFFTLLPGIATMDELRAEDPRMYQYMIANGFTLQRGDQIHPALKANGVYVRGDFGDGVDWMNFDLFRAIYCRYYAKP